MSPDPRLLRCFTVLADELHFGATAQRLNVAQPAISQQISRLEMQLGVRLFERTRRSVKLTEAGRAALPTARRAVAAAAEMEAVVAGFKRGERGRLRLGISPGVHYVAQAALLRFLRPRPKLRISTRQDSSGALARAVAHGDLDIAIGICTGAHDGVRAEHLRDEPTVLAVSVHHRLAGARATSVAELAEERFALVDDLDGPGYNQAVIDHCRRAGFRPRVAHEPHGPMAWEVAVRTKRCVGLTTRASAAATTQGVRLVPLEPEPTFPVELLYPADLHDGVPPVVAAFADAARTASA